MRAKWLLLLPLLFGACRSAVASNATSLQIQTHGSEFVHSPSEVSVSVPYKIANHGTASVFVEYCGDRLMIGLDQRESGQWVQGDDFCNGFDLVAQVEIRPGQVLEGTRVVFQPGEYRLRIGVTGSDDFASNRTSNRFASNSFIVR